MRVLLFITVVAAVEAEAAHRRGRRADPNHHVAVSTGRDWRDATRAKDTAKWEADQKEVESASVELTKLHADRAKLKQREVGVLSRREDATKSALEDAKLVVERLEGQVAAQEREISRQKTVIGGLEEDLGRMGESVLGTDGHGYGTPEVKAAPTAAPINPRVVEGLQRDVEREGAALLKANREGAALERDVQREGNALLKAEREAPAAVEAAREKITVREQFLSRKARGLATRAKSLESLLDRPDGSASARPLALAIGNEARKLERALLHMDRPGELEKVADIPAEHSDNGDVARAMEAERRPGAAHLEPAHLERPERAAITAAEERAQQQRADERAVQERSGQEGLERPHRRMLPRLVHDRAAAAEAPAPLPVVPATPVEVAALADSQEADTDDSVDNAAAEVPPASETLPPVPQLPAANLTLPAAEPAVVAAAAVDQDDSVDDLVDDQTDDVSASSDATVTDVAADDEADDEADQADEADSAPAAVAQPNEAVATRLSA